MYTLLDGREFGTSLMAAHDAASVGDVILYDGAPAFIVTSRTTLGFVTR